MLLFYFADDIQPTFGASMTRKLFSSLLLGLCLYITTPAQEKFYVPGDNLVIDGIPQISMQLVQDINRYREFRAAGFQAWHPVQKEMIISTRFAEVSQFHYLKFPGGARTQLTFLKDGPGGASFEPVKGEYFVFSKDTDGDEYRQLYRFDIKDGKITQLTNNKAQNGGYVWTNKGDKFAYSSTARNGADRDIWLMNPLDPAASKLLIENQGGGWGANDWSPDDQMLLYSQYLSVNKSLLWLYDLKKGEKILLTKGYDDQDVVFSGGYFSKDGKYVYTLTDLNSEFQYLAKIEVATGTVTPVMKEFQWDIDGFEFSLDHSHIAFILNENGSSKLHVRNMATMAEVKLPDLPVGLIGGLEWHKNGNDLAIVLNTARTASDVYSIDIAKSDLVRWTFSETGGIITDNFVEPELISWKSFDGKEITGFLYMPAKKTGDKVPVIIDVHGGPEGQARPGFLGSRNYLLNELGVAIIFPNIRGSTGFGKTFAKLDNGFLRDHSYKDIEALIDWIGTSSKLDVSRIMITGGSYGGNVTLYAAAFYSDKIKCALSIVGASSLVSFLENTAGYRRDLRRVEYGDERDPKMREYLNSIAPLNYAEKIKKPLFIVQGANDPRVPASEAVQMMETLKQIKTPHWYLMAKDEGHGFAKKVNQDYLYYATVKFIQEHLIK